MDDILQVTSRESGSLAAVEGKRRRMRPLSWLSILVAIVALVRRSKRRLTLGTAGRDKINPLARVPTTNSHTKGGAANPEFRSAVAQSQDGRQGFVENGSAVHSEIENEAEEIFEKSVSTLSGFAQPLQLSK